MHVSRLTLALVAGTFVAAAMPAGAGAQEIPGQYIVVLKDQASGAATAKTKRGSATAAGRSSASTRAS